MNKITIGILVILSLSGCATMDKKFNEMALANARASIEADNRKKSLYCKTEHSVRIECNSFNTGRRTHVTCRDVCSGNYTSSYSY